MKKNVYKFIDISKIEPNKEQPRTHFEDEKIQELSESIKENGLLQPIVVRPHGGSVLNKRYQIVVGERRYRACKLANIKEVPVLVQELDDDETANAALVENIQRENLSAIEEALAYQQILDSQNLTQKELADKMGKKQSTIANKLRLLQLPITVQESVKKKEITERHARALLKLKTTTERNQMLKRIIKGELTVEETEKLIKKKLEPKKKKNVTIKGGGKKLSQNLQIALNTIPVKSINKAIKTMQNFGVEAYLDQNENDEEVLVTIHIKK